MRLAGWTPKAAGWFVRDVSPDCQAVAATSVATEHSAPGEGMGTVHIGTRLHSVERTVSRLLGSKDEGYKTRTASTPVGYATAERRWREWPISPAEVGGSAAEITDVVASDGWRHVCALAENHELAIEAVHDSPAIAQATGFARLVVLVALVRGGEAALEAVASRLEEVVDRSDPAADDLRRAGHALSQWISGRT